jgi:hypothetical protein
MYIEKTTQIRIIGKKILCNYIIIENTNLSLRLKPKLNIIQLNKNQFSIVQLGCLNKVNSMEVLLGKSDSLWQEEELLLLAARSVSVVCVSCLLPFDILFHL